MWVQTKSLPSSVEHREFQTTNSVKRNCFAEDFTKNEPQNAANAADALLFSEELDKLSRQSESQSQQKSQRVQQYATVSQSATAQTKIKQQNYAEISSQTTRQATQGGTQPGTIPHAPIVNNEKILPQHPMKNAVRSGAKRTLESAKVQPTLASFGLVYLLGTCLAGVLHQSLTGTQTLYFTYYLENLIAVSSAAQPLSLFLSHGFSIVFSLTAVFLFGLSAFGIPCIIVFLLLKGMASGMLLLQLFAEHAWRGAAYYIALFGIPEAIFVTCICILCVTASKNARVIFRYTFYDEKAPREKSLGRYGAQYFILLALVLLIAAVSALSAGVFSQIIILQ